MIITPIPTTSLIRVSLGRLGECTFELGSERVNIYPRHSIVNCTAINIYVNQQCGGGGGGGGGRGEGETKRQTGMSMTVNAKVGTWWSGMLGDWVGCSRLVCMLTGRRDGDGDGGGGGISHTTWFNKSIRIVRLISDAEDPEVQQTHLCEFCSHVQRPGQVKSLGFIR